MDRTWWFGGAALGAVAVAWRWIGGFGTRVGRAAVQKVELDRWLGLLVLMYCRERKIGSGWAARSFICSYRYVRSLRRACVVISEEISSEPVLFWFRGAPIVFSISNVVKQTSSNSPPVVSEHMALYFIRGTVDIDGVLLAAMNRYNEYAGSLLLSSRDSYAGRFRVTWLSGVNADDKNNATISANKPTYEPGVGSSYGIDTFWAERGVRFVGFDNDDIGAQPPPLMGAVGSLALPESVIDRVEEVRRWLGLREWYLDRRIPWQFGWLLTGLPGSGKSSLCRNLAQDLDLPIYLFDLSSMSNQDFASAWACAVSNPPCMVLLEDFDVTFKGRENVAASRQPKISGNHLSFDYLLNKISGVDNSDGIFLVITSNHPETIDPAIASFDKVDPRTSRDVTSRPGRVDRIIQLGPLDEACRRKLAGIVLCDWPDVIEEMVEAGAGDTGAQFQSRCVGYALAVHRGWHDQSTLTFRGALNGLVAGE